MKVSNTFLSCFVFFLFLCVQGKLPANEDSYDYEQAFLNLYGTLLDDTAIWTTIADDGSIYVAGSTQGSFEGSTSYGMQDIFVLKLDPSGSVDWAEVLGTPLNDVPYGLHLDKKNGYLYVTGATQGSLASNNSGNYDTFVAKYNVLGNQIWISQFGGLRNDYGMALTMNSQGSHMMIIGHSNSPTLVGNVNNYTPLRNDSYDPTASVNSFSYDIMLAVCDIQNGTIVQTHLFGTQLNEFAYSTHSDGSSGILIGGETNANFSLGMNNTGEQSRDMLLLRVFENGTLDWFEQRGTNVTDVLYGITVDLLGNIFGVGITAGDLDLNVNQGLLDVAVLKWSSNGTLAWTKLFGSTEDDYAFSVYSTDVVTAPTASPSPSQNITSPSPSTSPINPVTVNQADVWIAGLTQGNMYDLGYYGGVSDAFVMQLDRVTGDRKSVKLIGTEGDDVANCVVTSNVNTTVGTPNTITIIVVGSTNGNIQGQSGSDDAFVVSYSPSQSQESSNGDKKNYLIPSVIVAVILLVAGIAMASFLLYKIKQYDELGENDQEMSNLEENDPEALGPDTLYAPIPESGMNPNHVDIALQQHRSTTIAPALVTWEIDFKEIHLEKKIGQGAYGIVHKGIWRKKVVAVKQLPFDSSSPEHVANFKMEAQLMRNLRPSKNVINYYGICVDPNHPLCIVTEFMPNGNLFDCIMDPSFPWTNKLRLKILRGIASGMYHLASDDIVHRDLAARNILLDEYYEPKISDFGMSSFEKFNNPNKTESNIGPIRWMAPESLRYKEYTQKSDVWAFGVLMWELWERKSPYDDMETLQVALQVADRLLRLNVPQGVPGISDLMARCFDWEPQNRPDFEKITDILENVVSTDDQDNFIQISLSNQN